MMRIKLVRAALAGGLLLAALPAAASAAIHPIVSSECAAQASQTGAGQLADPPGQTPAGFPLDQSDLRALQATGFLTINPDGTFTVDPTVGAANGSNGQEHCGNLNP